MPVMSIVIPEYRRRKEYEMGLEKYPSRLLEQAENRLASLAGNAEVTVWARRAAWSVEQIGDLPTGVSQDGQMATPFLNALGPDELRLFTSVFVPQSETSSFYEPFRDAPALYLDLAVFGEDVLKVGFKYDEGLVHQAIELVQEYGPLWFSSARPDYTFSRWLTVYDFMAESAALALALKANRLLDEDDSDAMIVFLENVRPGAPMSTPLLSRGSTYLSKFALLDVTDSRITPRNAMRMWLSDLVNTKLDALRVVVQVTEFPEWGVGYKTPSLLAVAWAQFAAALQGKFIHKRCAYVRCMRWFRAANPRQDYCGKNEGRNCQNRAKQHRIYHRPGDKTQRKQAKAKVKGKSGNARKKL